MAGALVLTPFSIASAAESAADKGKAVAVDRKKGNCLACHAMGDGTLPGNIGPALVNIKLRFPEKAELRKQIWDATTRNPNSIMPPFGRHKMLSEEQIDQIVEYIYTL
jgi:sulfur-oxidizing protein SoxX